MLPGTGGSIHRNLCEPSLQHLAAAASVKEFLSSGTPILKKIHFTRKKISIYPWTVPPESVHFNCGYKLQKKKINLRIQINVAF